VISPLYRIRRCLETGDYILRAHQKQRERERGVTRAEVLFVLKNGKINLNRCGFDTKLQREKYAIQGRTIDSRQLEIIVAFDEEGRLEIITTYAIKNG